MKEIHQSPSIESQAMLTALQSAVEGCLEQKRRLGQYAIVWTEGQAQRMEMNSSEIQGLLSERTFLLRELDTLPAAAQLTRSSLKARLRNVDCRIGELGSE